MTAARPPGVVSAASDPAAPVLAGIPRLTHLCPRGDDPPSTPRLEGVPSSAEADRRVPAGPTPNSTGPLVVSASASDSGLSAGLSGTSVLAVHAPDCWDEEASCPWEFT